MAVSKPIYGVDYFGVTEEDEAAANGIADIDPRLEAAAAASDCQIVQTTNGARRLTDSGWEDDYNNADFARCEEHEDWLADEDASMMDILEHLEQHPRG